MSKRNRREHGRILSVETMQRGDSLAVDVAAGATSITVNDAGDFDEDGGWLYIGAQTVEYTDCDDDTGVITLADPLAAAGEEGDPVYVWSDLYDEVVDYQLALVELDGEYDNPDPVVAEVAEGVGDLPEGDRGKAGESCTLLRIADDEWELVEVGGRPRKSRSLRFEADDFYALTAADITAGTATIPLSHRPNDEALTCVLAGVPQRPTNWTINYDAQTLTMPLSGWEWAGDVLWVHYAYRKGVTTSVATSPPNLAGLPIVGWFSAAYAATNYADGATMSGWANLAAGKPNATGSPVFHAAGGPNGGPYLTIPTGVISFGSIVLGAIGPGNDTDGGEMFLSIKADSTTVKSDWFNFGDNGLDSNYPDTGGGVIDEFGSSSRLTYTPTMPIDQWRRYDTWSAPNDRAALIDEVVQATSATNTVSWLTQAFGNTGGVGFKGKLAAVLLFDRKLTAAERAQVVEFLQANPSGGMP